MYRFLRFVPLYSFYMYSSCICLCSLFGVILFLCAYAMIIVYTCMCTLHVHVQCTCCLPFQAFPVFTMCFVYIMYMCMCSHVAQCALTLCPHRLLTGLLCSSQRRWEMSLLPNPYSKQGPTLTSQIRYIHVSCIAYV